jgi:predicted HAD superfamily Cof-like phosphohydrolase
MSYYDDVVHFHGAFRLPVGKKPELPNESEQALRLRLVREEWIELRQAHLHRSLEEVAREIADLIYVACGMAVSYGIPLNEVWNEVHRSNMAKITKRGPKYRTDGKVLKPYGWQPPDIKKALESPRGESV